MTMSTMLAKTWNYLHQATTQDPAPGWNVPTKEQRHHLPSGLASWLHQVTACLDKEEERELVSRQLQLVTARLSQKSVSGGVASDCLVRLVTMHLLGHDTSAAYIHCVKLAGAGSVLGRKMGYLACSVMVPPSHELLLLVTNTILRDLASTNLVDIQLGLVAAANLVTSCQLQLVPVLLERAVCLLRHNSHLVRKKSLVLVDHLCCLDPAQWRGAAAAVISVLGDTNPGVATASVQVLSRRLAPSDGAAVVRLAVSTALEVQEAVARAASSGALPPDYLYRGHPAPHLQIYCTALYRRDPDTVTADSQLSDRVVSVLQSTLTTYCGCKDLIIQALLYETVVTITSLAAARCLLPLALRSVGGFLTSRHHSTVYTGLAALDLIFRQRPPQLTSDQEAAVLSCLAHSDPAIQRRAAELLLVVADKDNVVTIVDRVLGHVASSEARTDYSRVVDRVVLLVERFGDAVQDCDWKASTLLRIVQVSKQQQRDRMLERLKLLLAACDEEGDAAAVLELNRVRIKLRALLSDIVTSRQQAGRAVPPPVTSLQVWCAAQFYSPDEEDSLEIVRGIVDTAARNTEHGMVTLHCIAAVQSLVMWHGPASVGEAGLQLVRDCALPCHDPEVRRAARVCATIIRHASSTPPPSVQTSPDLTLSFLDPHMVARLRAGELPLVPRPEPCPGSQGPGLVTVSPSAAPSRSARGSERSWSPDTETAAGARSVWTREGRADTPDTEAGQSGATSCGEGETEAGTGDQQSGVSSVITGDWD